MSTDHGQGFDGKAEISENASTLEKGIDNGRNRSSTTSTATTTCGDRSDESKVQAMQHLARGGQGACSQAELKSKADSHGTINRAEIPFISGLL